jgi:tetratricopeptide (TPR) repeat protein
MLSSRNIHFAILGIILGATSGYVFAFYQIDQKIPASAPPLASPPTGTGAAAGAPGHPDVSNEQVLAMFKTELGKDPNNVELLSRYGDFLSDIERFQDAVDVYKKVLTIEPTNLNVQTYMGTALWNIGKRDEAVAAYQKSLKADPNHLPSLYYMALVDLDMNHDVAAATAKLTKMEKIDPQQPALQELRKRIDEARKKAK